MATIHQLKLLVNLAYADGEITEKERNYILNIGQANHFLVAEILPLFTREHKVNAPLDLSEKEKFDYLLSMIQLMKIDEKIYKKEIQYCAKVASSMGYRTDLVLALLLDVKNVTMKSGEMEELRKVVATYLRES